MNSYEILKASDGYYNFLCDMTDYLDARGFEDVESAVAEELLFDEYLAETFA
jgi:N-acetylglutamate synthase-like GNAT family acetyltransferase